jgi:methylenetetrahydrofolate reductase (NADPH)
MVEITPADDRARFEVLPFEDIAAEAARLPRAVRVTVTCSPKHGPDRGVQTAARLRQLGHSVTVHVAARMVRDREHLDQLLAGMADAGVEDLFLIAGDVEGPVGEYSSAMELLALVADHPERPELIGVAGYPEGHPLISDEELERALRAKSRLADYVVTQMCFDAGTLRGWIEREREQGIELPVVIGMPGKVTRRKLLRMATRIGVGPSLDFLRKQKGLRALLSRRSTADRLFDDVVPLLDDPLLAVAGFQYFTFNELLQTWEWHQRKASIGLPAHRGEVCPEMTG